MINVDIMGQDMIPSKMNYFQESLKNKGYKVTAQRQAILNVIAENAGKHLSAEEIYELVKKKKPEIGLATVYRTLLVMAELRIVIQPDRRNEFNKYELNNNAGNFGNPHLICMKCGNVMGIDEGLLGEDCAAKILMKYYFEVKDAQLKIYGICKECSKKP
jgi:Fur family ferric uptake transcriptional regulator